GDQIWLYPIDPARATRFKYTRRASASKMVGMSENDTLPNMDIMWRQNVKWLFFCTWDRERLLKPDPDNQPYGLLQECSEKYNSYERLHRVYNDPRVLNLDQLDWRP
ncbi:MAG: hypothetical protein FWH26_08785, partial [Oscillospiraceae bacterium]|nr:hypothetical protein [Oscillospiraceae bacterium]